MLRIDNIRRPLVSMTAVVGACALSIVISACGSSTTAESTSAATETAPSTATSAAPSAAPSSSSDFQSLLDAQTTLGYEGTYEVPALSPVEPVAGKNVWLISVGLSAGSPVQTAEGFEAAAAELGWDATVFDGKFDPSQWLAGIRQAIAAKADGIWIYSFDCAPVKAALQEAKAAGIPVVLSQGLDCGTGSDGLATYNMPYMGVSEDGVVSKAPGDLENWARSFGAGAGWWLMSATERPTKIIEFVETDLQTTVWNGEGFEQAIAHCSDCEIVERVEFVGTDFGPKLQQMAEQALLKHPEANAIYGAYDSAMSVGIAGAIRSSGRGDSIVAVGGEGFAENLQLLQEGIQDGGTGYEAPWEGWAAADALLRIFQGAEQPTSSGIGYQFYDKDNNLPESGDYVTGLPYRDAYVASWGLS